jgi:glycosyltransferase involved in cell wall biosynthesis
LKIILFANTDWYLYNFRLSLAQALKDQGHEVLLLSPSGDYAGRFQESGFRWEALDFNIRGTNPIRELGIIAKLVRLYRRERPDIVHHFTIKCVLYGSLAARLAGVKGIVDAITGLGYIFIGKGFQAAAMRQVALQMYRLALRGVRVIFQNPDDMQVFQELKLVRPGQCVLIKSSGINTDRFHPTPEPDGAPTVVLAARMLWDKGVGEFVEAARILKHEGSPARFILVGTGFPGNPASIADDQLAAWEREGLVEWWRWRDDMADVYAQSHIVCLPSYREGLPRSLAEAAACGRPLVAADVPGCKEIVRDGVNGYLVPVRDAAALAGALRKLINAPALRQSMGACSREMALAEVSEERVLTDTLKVYNSLDLPEKNSLPPSSEAVR